MLEHINWQVVIIQPIPSSVTSGCFALFCIFTMVFSRHHAVRNISKPMAWNRAITDPTMNAISKRRMEWALVDNYILIKQERGCFQTSIINLCIPHSLNFTSKSQFLASNTSTNKLLHFLIETNFCFHYSNWFFDWNSHSRNLVLVSPVRRIFDINSESLSC